MIVLFFFFVFPAFGLASSPLQIPYGGAGAASLKDDFSFQINPALLGFQTRPELLVSYSLEGEDQKGLLAMQDKKGGLPLGLSYERLWKSKGQPENKWSVSIGQNLGSYLSFGFSIHKDQLKPPWNADMGVLFKPGINTALGLVLSNITLSRPKNKREKFFTVGAYQNFGGFFNIRMDASHLKKEGWIFKGGFESVFYDFLALRAGGHWNSKKKKGILSGGLGFQGPRLQMEYGMQKENDLKIQSHVFSAKLIF